jgi:hypothetical protein
MNKRMILGLLGLAFIAGLGVADDLVPIAVSPGAEKGPAVVRQSCPTFSWTAVSWALTYKVVIFEAGDGEVPAYEKIAASAAPVLVKEIPGKAFSWTPSADEPLINGGSYVWYVGAMVNAAQGSWSEGRKFIIAESPAWGVVSEPRKDGIGAGDSRQILRDKDLELTAAAKENFNLTDDLASQDLIDVEGTEGTSNTFYGTSAGNTTMTGTYNSFFGNLAGNLNKSGTYNTFLGRAAGNHNTTGNANLFVGNAAGYLNTTASGNTFVGYTAGYKNTTGTKNIFVGSYAGYSMTSGADNTIVGHNAGYYAKGSGNVFIGRQAGNGFWLGNDNVAIGNCAGWYANGSGNVFIGNCVGTGDPGQDYAYEYNNQLIIGNTWGKELISGDFSNEILRFNGKVGISKTPTTYALEVSGGAYCDGTTWHDSSSREYKENIVELTSAEAIRAFEKLEPVKFNYKQNKEEECLGFIAVNDRKSLVPMDMVAMLTKVVQEQQKDISDLKEEIAKLKKKSQK